MPSSRNRSASPARASRERSSPQASAAGIVSSAALSTHTSGITGESRSSVVSQAAYISPHRLPPSAGSSARRRGREAARQRLPITTTTPIEPAIITAKRTSASALATPASGATTSTLSGLGRKSIVASCRTKVPKTNTATSARSIADTSRPAVTKLSSSATNTAFQRSANRNAALCAAGASMSARIVGTRIPKPEAVSSRPTALSGRRRQAIRPQATKEIPARSLIRS